MTLQSQRRVRDIVDIVLKTSKLTYNEDKVRRTQFQKGNVQQPFLEH